MILPRAHGGAQTHVTSSPLPDLPGDLLCRIALGNLQPDDLPPPPPPETDFSPAYDEWGEEESRLKRQGDVQRLCRAWEEFRARRQLLAAFRGVCRAWRAALTEGMACLPTWLSPEAALHPVGLWPQRLHTLCLAVPGQVLKEHPDLESWQQQLSVELHALYPNLLHLHFRVIDLMPCLEYLSWNIGLTSEDERAPKWRACYSGMDCSARDIPPLVLGSELLPEGAVQLHFEHENFEWSGRGTLTLAGRSSTLSSSDSPLESRGPLTLRTLMPLVERFLLDQYPEMNAEGSEECLKFSGLRHKGGGNLEMDINFWPTAPNPYGDGDDDDWD